ncbi:MAG: Carboxypeptidase regulatory-like domain [Candidatus Hydrogenedentota bacterium]
MQPAAWIIMLSLAAGVEAEPPAPKQGIVVDFCNLIEDTEFLDFLNGAVGDRDLLDVNGTVTIEDGVPRVTGNGMPDLSVEFGLLEAILADPQFDNGVLSHAGVRAAWTANLAQMRGQQLGGILAGILDAQLPGLVEMLTAYVTLGDGSYARGSGGTGSFGFVAALLDQFDGLLENLTGLPGGLLLRDATLDKGDYITLPDLAGTLQSDADGDGLSNANEYDFFGGSACDDKGEAIAYSQGALSTDADDDGMSDDWEARYHLAEGEGLEPAIPDALLDPDGDLLPNIEEFLVDSDPLDLDDPEVTRFVATNGDNRPFPDAGGPDNPWSIQFGISETPDVPGDKPVRLNLDPGEYFGDITMKPGMIISGINRFDSKGEDDDEAVIIGEIIGAEGARLEFVTVQAPFDAAVLLTTDDVAMRVSGVTFRGTAARQATGVFTSGLAPARSVIDGSRFTQLGIGLDIGDGIPKLRRSVFDPHAISQVVVRSSVLSGAGSEGLGDARDPEVGFNLFRDPASTAIINERPATLRVEENDWDTNEPEEIQARVQGNVDFEPFLLKGQAVLAATLFCGVRDADAQTPIEDASVSLVPSGYNPVTQNEGGVYTFAAIAAGEYTVRVEAEGYVTRNVIVNLAGGVESISVAMTPPQAGAPDEGMCCGQGGKRAPGAGDLLVGLATLALLAGLGLTGYRP